MVPGAPFKSTAMGWTMRHPAPRLGQHNDEILRRPVSPRKAPGGPRVPGTQRLPLAGSACWISAGCGRHFVTLQLAHLGAAGDAGRDHQAARYQSRHPALCGQTTGTQPRRQPSISGTRANSASNSTSPGPRRSRSAVNWCPTLIW